MKIITLIIAILQVIFFLLYVSCPGVITPHLCSINFPALYVSFFSHKNLKADFIEFDLATY